MSRVRAFFFMEHRTLAVLVVMAALCMKIVVPSGLMIGQNAKVLTVQLCTDGIGEAVTAKIAIPMGGEHGDSSGKQGKGECPFASLSMASMTGGPILHCWRWRLPSSWPLASRRSVPLTPGGYPSSVRRCAGPPALA
ncbi:hypothetical protein ACFSTD_14355 [Novosphingobium colocasiae]